MPSNDAEKTTATTPKKRASTSRPRSPRANGARREQEVLDAATKVFHTRGYADASVQDIADELGILKGSLYHYIDSKEDLLARLLDDTHRDVEAILEEIQALKDISPLERLHQYFELNVAYMTRNVAKFAIYYHDMDQLSEVRLRDLNRKRALHRRFVVDLITEAQAAGEIKADLNPDLTANIMFGSMIWVYRWFRPGGKFKADQVSAAVADFITRGVRAA